VKFTSSSVPGHSTQILGAVAVAGLLWLPITAPAQPKPPTSAAPPQGDTTQHSTAAEQEEWRKALLAIPRPNNGCFTANYPEKAWREVPCAPSTPHKLYPPRPGGMSQIDIVGGAGPDFSATVTGHISTAEGSFDSATGITSNGGYSLQLNTAPFQTSACAGSPGGTTGGCQGWEQFVYESSGSSFIQYWLLTYGPAGTMCPTPRHTGCAAGSSYSDGWCPFQFTSTGPVYCVVNAVNQPSTTSQPMTSLGQMKVAGAAASGSTNDSITVTEPGGPPHSATGNNYFPDLGSQWNEVEYNVFGNGNSSQATFNSGATLQVRTEVISGTNQGPGCHLKSWTGESNNLTLVNAPPTLPAPLPAPALVFSESNPAPSGPTADCSDAVSLGDTHLTTFGGLLYDFQATGDFLLAETGPGFLVQTRQASGAPTWPNAAVNKAVAVQAGKNRVAICLPGRVVVDGKSVRVADGGRLGLSGGGNVLRKGNVYYVLAPSGDSIRATVNSSATANSSHIDVAVGLGRWPAAVHGLLANANNNVNEIAARDGAVLTSPLSFEGLYGHYADSWRVASNQSMLSPCGEDRERAVPTKPFFANDLPPELAKRNQAICAKAGVKEGPLLEACVIDVTMIGPSAAKVFVGRPSPVVWGDARKK
jgi:hypothetical protein